MQFAIKRIRFKGVISLSLFISNSFPAASRALIIPSTPCTSTASNTSRTIMSSCPTTLTPNTNTNTNHYTTYNMKKDSTENVKDLEEVEGENEIHKPTQIHTHYIFLIHGWLGNPQEMGSIEAAIQKTTNNCDKRVITHSATSNHSKTNDGIAKGGERLAQEVQEYIQNDIQNHVGNDHDDNTSTNDDADANKNKNTIDVSVSFVGNSLGGLYARYALSILPQRLHVPKATATTSIQLHYHTFATTATPHLGVSSNTYLTIPRFLEHVVGRALRTSGKDLFRLDNTFKTSSSDSASTSSPYKDLIYHMCTDYDTFLKPLSLFQRRMAYINAFQTDFQVPTSTAAFLSNDNKCPHYIQTSKAANDKSGLSDSVSKVDDSFIVARAITEPNEKELLSHAQNESDMSVKLDSLGWEKVFVDVREKIPTPSIPKPSFGWKKKTSREEWDDFVQSQQRPQTNANVIVTSSELNKFMNASDRIHIPVGHQVMVANSKSKSYEKFTEGGKPVMDHFAQDLINGLFTCESFSMNE